ncbi:MAG: hypothetical protein KFF73_02420 [Cyclobacteriaceae bacterium]|nr:hypothetical protein [Cyclobacteriaceae bacterium]
MDLETNPGEVLVEFDNRNSEITGNFYVDDSWKKSNIRLKSGTEIKNMLVRYDLEYDMLEVKLSGNTKVVPLRKLDHYRVIEQNETIVFRNCDVYAFEDGTELAGICRVIDEGYYGGIIKYTYHIKDATYVPALDMGDQNDKIIIKQNLFLTKDNILYRIPSRKREFYSFFINPGLDIKSYMVKNHLNHKEPEDLEKILKFINKKGHP